MNNIIEYNGYQAVIEYSAEDATLFGKVMDIDDRILFEIEDPGKAEEVFKDVIEDYLEMCKEVSKEPCKPYKGSFNVRISPELHKKAVQAARKKHISLNAFVESLFDNYFGNKAQSIEAKSAQYNIIINQLYSGTNNNGANKSIDMLYNTNTWGRSDYDWQYKM